MKLIIPSVVFLALIACDSSPPQAPVTPVEPAVPASPNTPDTGAVPPSPAPSGVPDEAPAEKATPDTAGAEPAKSGGVGLLPEPDFQLKGPDLKAPTSAPSEESWPPKLLDLDLKKE
jgi:hypothetical protein